MSNRLRDRYRMKPGQFWCIRGGGRVRVTLGTCISCEHRKNCDEYSNQVMTFNEEPDHQPYPPARRSL